MIVDILVDTLYKQPGACHDINNHVIGRLSSAAKPGGMWGVGLNARLQQNPREARPRDAALIQDPLCACFATASDLPHKALCLLCHKLRALSAMVMGAMRMGCAPAL